ncbi:MAG: hypothetical protein J5J00_00550 [Deltaproteobacteria bacterium]|nr:hypothetical protein [Deltaproteobacteria bacterium]
MKRPVARAKLGAFAEIAMEGRSGIGSSSPEDASQLLSETKSGPFRPPVKGKAFCNIILTSKV